MSFDGTNDLLKRRNHQFERTNYVIQNCKSFSWRNKLGKFGNKSHNSREKMIYLRAQIINSRKNEGKNTQLS